METATFVLITTIVMLILVSIIYTVLTYFFLGKGVKQNELTLSKKDILKISIVAVLSASFAYYITSLIISYILNPFRITIITDFYDYIGAIKMAEKWIPLIAGTLLYYKAIHIPLTKRFPQTEKTKINEIVNRTAISVVVAGILVGIIITPLIKIIASMIIKSI